MTEQCEALRLADVIERQDWEWSDVPKVVAELRRLVAQRDLLVQVLKDCEIALRTVAKDDDEFVLARHQIREVRAAIRAVEE